MGKTQIASFAFLLVIFGFLMMLTLWVVPRFSLLSAPPRIASTPTLVQQVQTLSQLVTVQYVLEKVVILEDAKWFGENRVLMVAHGIVKAGVNLGDIKSADIQASGKKVTIKMPPARVIDCYLDDRQTKVIERTTGLLRTFDKDMEQNARQQAVQEINLAARDSGIIKDANDRARIQMINLFRQMGFEDVEFK
jgi:hypothetical protein